MIPQTAVHHSKYLRAMTTEYDVLNYFGKSKGKENIVMSFFSFLVFRENERHLIMRDKMKKSNDECKLARNLSNEISKCSYI